MGQYINIQQPKLKYELNRITSFMQKYRLESLDFYIENLDEVLCIVNRYHDVIELTIDEDAYYTHIETKQSQDNIRWDIENNITFKDVFESIILTIKEYIKTYKKEHKVKKKGHYKKK